MNSKKYFLTSVVLGGLALLAGCANQPPTSTAATILFGRTGGNIRPYTISIGANGNVASDYPSDCISKGITLLPDQLSALNAQAQGSAFQNLPEQIGSHLPNPDRASLFIEVKTDTADKRVIKASGTNPTFDGLYSTLTGLTTKTNCNL